jgi:3-isopropylmalate/(R)-2-methylmalate dehydratase small subunit
LGEQTVKLDDGWTAKFDIDPFRRDCLLQGLDDIGLTLKREDAITAFETRRPAWLPARR